MNLIELFGITFEEYNSKNFKNNKPIVSVYCITYNHIDYIKDCLEGIVNQKTDYEYELVIFDDASSDGTSDIIRKYAQIYPHLIHAFIARKNSYLLPQRGDLSKYFRNTFLKGTFVAFCEGDDYWTDIQKLQIQVNFLLKNCEYSLTVHNGIKQNCVSNTTHPMVTDYSDHEIITEDIIMRKGGMCPTASFVGKKQIFTDSFELFSGQAQDWAIQLFSSYIGKVFYFSKCMSVYRFFVKNSWTNRTYICDKTRILDIFNNLEILSRFNKLSNYAFENVVNFRQTILWASVIDLISQPLSEFELLVSTVKNCIPLNLNKETYINQMYSKRSLIFSNKERFSSNSDINKLISKFVFKNLIIYCASTAGERMLENYKRLGVDVKFFVDSDSSKDNSVFCGKKVICVSTLDTLNLDDYIIQIASIDYDSQIEKVLKKFNKCNYITAHTFYSYYLQDN